MKYHELQTRIANNVDRDDISELINDIINDVREEAAEHPLGFLEKQKTISLVVSTFSYAIDKGEATGRFGSIVLDIRYDDNSGNTPVSLDFHPVDIFNIMYPTQETGDPTAYTIKGEDFTVNSIPSTVTSKTFIPSYIMLPDRLTNEYDEAYIDKKYYNYIIARVCERIFMEYLREDEASIKWASYWLDQAKKERSKMLLKESIFINPNSVINKLG